ncbi:signal peptidase I [Leuconostoc gelidum]|uniref:signal peptidase I n=1 Tax=Leuconostoc gelidum TaxID=1244 RepID=UPI001CC5DE49
MKRGNVIVFNAYPEDPKLTAKKLYIKRVIGLPGDTISSNNGKIYVNKHQINQNYLTSYQKIATGNWNLKILAEENSWRTTTNSYTVPKNKYFVLGDNRSISNDSRYWGFVSNDKIIGIVYVPFWGTKTQQKTVNDQKNIFFEG